MTDAEKEDLLIRRILIAIPVILVAGFLATVALVAVMISYNFNPMNWME